VTGVQAALDLRAPDTRRSDRASRAAEAKPVTPEVPSAGQVAAAAPLAVIRAAHVEYSQESAGGDKTERATRVADKPETVLKLADRPAERQNQDKPDTPARAAEKTPEKPVEKSADKASDKPADKSAEKHAEKPDTNTRGADKTASRAREAAPGASAGDLEPGVAGAVHTRVADAGH
jgi:ribonuclease-3